MKFQSLSNQSELETIISTWLATEWPHGFFELYITSRWIGWIYCQCRGELPKWVENRRPALARIEHNRIAIIDQNHAWNKTGAHKLCDNCPDVNEIFHYYSDPTMFEKLKLSLNNSHDKWSYYNNSHGINK